MCKIARNAAFFIFFAALFYLLLASVISIAASTGGLAKMRQSALVLPSLGLFIGILLLSIYNIRFYFVFLIFQLIAFPSVINYVFPSVLFGPTSDLINTPYPFISNIDIYLIFGIIIGLNRNLKHKYNSSTILVSLLFLVLSFAINLITFESSTLMNLLFVGSFHIRYIILMYILFNIYDIRRFQNEIIGGLIISIFFLFVEASVFSYINKIDRLTSGTLAVNTFGNIIGSIGVSLAFVLFNNNVIKYRVVIVFAIILSLIIVISTENRSSFFALLIGIPYIFLLRTEKMLTLIGKGLFFISILFLSLYLLPMRKVFSILPERVNIFNYVDKIQVKNGHLKIEPSPETNPLIARIKLFSTSMEMIKDRPIAGIGVGRWNYLKGEYGLDEKIVLDSHNGILSILSQNGLLGLPFLFMIYAYPSIVYRRQSRSPSILSNLIIINIIMAFCDLTNAGVFKYQVSSLMIFIVFISGISKASEIRSDIESHKLGQIPS